MIGADHDQAVVALCCLHQLVCPGDGERQRPLHEDMQLGTESSQHMRLMEMTRRADQQGVELAEFNQLLDVLVGIRNGEAVGQRPRLGEIIVADPDHLDLLQALQGREVPHLGGGACPDDSQPHSLRHRTLPLVSERSLQFRPRKIAAQNVGIDLPGS